MLNSFSSTSAILLIRHKKATHHWVLVVHRQCVTLTRGCSWTQRELQNPVTSQRVSATVLYVKTAQLSWATAQKSGSPVKLWLKMSSSLTKRKKNTLLKDSHWKINWSGNQRGTVRAKAEHNAISQDEQSEKSNKERQTTAQRGGHSEGSSAFQFRQEIRLNEWKKKCQLTETALQASWERWTHFHAEHLQPWD